VIFACFFSAFLISLLYHSSPYNLRPGAHAPYSAEGPAFFEGLPWVPDPSRFVGRIGVPAILSAPHLISPFVSLVDS